ncbi:hypothetical protein CFC21_069016 [Triticum aestivum]|uniref:Uncharacterized protein n=2 Tax=Triticum aestivum TaxID=4565 RepID=A0A3B6KTM1_WHEAT|nr:hypothetical protein CFC21_069016 [Triticum aestivum]
MASRLESLMKRLWSYLPSSLSSSRSDPPQQIPDPTDDPPADQVGDTPPAPEVSDLEHLPSPNHIGRLDGAVEADLAVKPKLGSSTSFPRHKIHDPVGDYSSQEGSRRLAIGHPDGTHQGSVHRRGASLP